MRPDGSHYADSSVWKEKQQPCIWALICRWESHPVAYGLPVGGSMYAES